MTILSTTAAAEDTAGRLSRTAPNPSLSRQMSLVTIANTPAVRAATSARESRAASRHGRVARSPSAMGRGELIADAGDE